MKKIAQVQEVENEGLLAFMGKPIFVMCGNYFYTGILAGVSDVCIRLDKPSLVYSTGDWEDKNYADIQSLNTDSHYVMLSHIESFGPGKG
jgi:hypothetical protein